jgi:GPH family glycoside/pentoside/hexuronide:cation symporter
LTLTIFFPAARGANSRLVVSSYTKMALTLSLLIGLAALSASLGTWNHRESNTTVSPGGNLLRWRDLMHNRAFVALASSAAVFFLASVINASLSVYFFTYYAGIERGTVLAWCQFALFGGAIAGVGIWARFARSHEKHYLHAAGCLLTGGLVLGGFWVARPGVVWGGAIVPLLVLGHAFAGAAGSGLLMLPPSMLADVAEEHELRVGRRCEGAFFGAFSCVLQLATGLAVAIGGLLVDYFAGVVPGAATQAPLTIHRIGVLACLLPGVLMMVAGLLILPYQVTRDRTKATRHALALSPDVRFEAS